MITGDNEETAKAIASESNIKEYYASCLPETKVETIKKAKRKIRDSSNGRRWYK